MLSCAYPNPVFWKENSFPNEFNVEESSYMRLLRPGSRGPKVNHHQMVLSVCSTYPRWGRHQFCCLLSWQICHVKWLGYKCENHYNATPGAKITPYILIKF